MSRCMDSRVPWSQAQVGAILKPPKPNPATREVGPEREARVLKSLIPALHGFKQADGTSLLVMEMLQGPLQPDEAIALL